MASGHKEIYSASLFVDSGAFSLFNLKVLKYGERESRTGRELARPPIRWTQGDFSYYDLRKGTEFRRYCDSYASFMKKMEGRGILFANVDAISNPDLTWEIQQFFEKEHGVSPVPVVHYATPLKYVDRYLHYPLLGVGGLGHQTTRRNYSMWADNLFTHICPKENDYLPVVRTHGFAMTSWHLICRYPWWSVDSASWIKLAAYGDVYVPRWSEDKSFRFDRPPMILTVSSSSPAVSGRAHYRNALPSVRLSCEKWLEHIGIDLGSVDGNGKMKDHGVTSHYRARAVANLTYLKCLEESRPKWPHPLDSRVVTDVSVRYNRGFGL